MKSRNYRNAGVENKNMLNLPKETGYGSIHRIQSDQKNIIIDKLKLESGHLTKNQQQFQQLREKYYELDKRYRHLQEQKSLQEIDYKNRHQSCIRNICQLKNELDAMKAELTDKRVEISDLQSEHTVFSQGLDEKSIQLDKLKAEISSLKGEEEQLKRDKQTFGEQSKKLAYNNMLLREEYENLRNQNGKAEIRRKQIQHYAEQLQIEADLLKKKLTDYQENNNALDHEVQEVLQDIHAIEGSIQSSQAQIKTLKTINAELGANVEKYRSEAIHLQKSTQAELMKNNQTIKQLKQAQNILKVRHSQIQQGQNEIDTLKNQHQDLQKINNQLVDDLEACHKHLEDLGMLNRQLLVSLQGFGQEDKDVTCLIDRKSRLQYAHSRLAETDAINYNLGKYTERTDFSVSNRSYLA